MAFSLRNVAIAVAAGACIICGTVVGVGRCTRSPQSVPVGSSQSGARFVKLVFRATPPDAEVFVDDVRKGKAGEVIELPRSEAAIKVVIRRDGYLPLTISLVPERDRFVKDIVLVPDAGAKPSNVP